MQNKICFRLLLYVYSLTMLIHVSIALLFFCFSALLNLVISPLCRDLYQLTVSCGLPIHTRYVHSRTLFWCPCSFHSCQRCSRFGRCRYFRKIRAVSLAPYPQLCDLPCLTISTPAICAQDSHPTPTPSPPPAHLPGTGCSRHDLVVKQRHLLFFTRRSHQFYPVRFTVDVGKSAISCVNLEMKQIFYSFGLKFPMYFSV